MTPIYVVILRLCSIRTSNLPGEVDSGGDPDGLAILRERRVAFVWLIGVDAHP